MRSVNLTDTLNQTNRNTTMTLYDIEACAPAVHSNGNSKESLVEEWYAFHEALQEAIDLIPSESFNRRNHYLKANCVRASQEGNPEHFRRHLTSTLLQLRSYADHMGEHIDTL